MASSLLGSHVPGLYVAEIELKPLILQEAADLGLAICEMNGDNVRTKADFLNELSRACRFPAYFGHNWDAAEECLSDLSWLDANGFLILYESFLGFAVSAPDDFEVACDIFDFAVSAWKQDGTAMYVILMDHTLASGDTPLRFPQLGRQ